MMPSELVPVTNRKRRLPRPLRSPSSRDDPLALPVRVVYSHGSCAFLLVARPLPEARQVSA